MSIVESNLNTIIGYRLEWLNHRAQLLNDNIVRADMPNEFRKEILRFKDFIQNKKRLDKANTKEQDRTLFLPSKEKISKELEVLEMSRTSIEHEALTSVIKEINALLKSIINSNNQG